MDLASLETLLERWSEAREQGRDLPAAEFCRERPELADELARRIAECRHMSVLMRELATPTLHGPQPTMAASSRRTVSEERVTAPGFEILRELGRGGMGVVYLARDLEMGRLVALKMLPVSACAGEEGAARFRQEVEAAARVSHPGMVRIFELGEIASPGIGSRPYLTMEYCDGGNLHERIGGKPLAREATNIVESLARTMHAVHQAGVVHRDLKPGNVLLSFSREPSASASADALAGGSRLNEYGPKVTDFGLAKLLGDSDAHSGLVMGTPSYMAPEQAEGRGDEVGPLADVWALGAILYECLTGRPPFLGATVLETLQQVVRREPGGARVHAVVPE